jgi:hypothetical protein
MRSIFRTLVGYSEWENKKVIKEKRFLLTQNINKKELKNRKLDFNEKK